MADELKACPFCGVVNTHMASGWLDGRYNEEEWFQVECQECCAAGPSKPFEYKAAEAWNNAGAATARAEAAEQRAKTLWREVARLRAVIAEAADHLPIHPPAAQMTPAEADAEEVRVCLLAALAQPDGEVIDD